ncbi:GNAT family N-acetyltransferase [Parvimonas sp. G1425]
MIKLKKWKNIFSIFNEDEFLGIIQQIRVEKDNIHIGRIIINPKKQGMGFGKEAIRGFIDLIFKDESIKSISLNVFDSNKNARNIYTKLGFEIDEVIETPKLKYLMKKYRQ